MRFPSDFLSYENGFFSSFYYFQILTVKIQLLFVLLSIKKKKHFLDCNEACKSLIFINYQYKVRILQLTTAKNYLLHLSLFRINLLLNTKFSNEYFQRGNFLMGKYPLFLVL